MSAPDVAIGSTFAAPSTETALVDRIRAGDEAACEALYLGHHEALWRFAYAYVHAPDVAEELVQDVFLALWRDRATWDVRVGVRAWLFGAVRNRARNHLRHERIVARLTERAAVPPPDAVGMGTRFVDPQTTVEEQELTDAVARAIATLPERRRIALTLRWKHELSAAEIARVLGTTPESVRVLLTRGRQELAQLLGRARR